MSYEISDRLKKDRAEREKAWGDAVYETWRAGGNSDLVERDEVDRLWFAGTNVADIPHIIARKLARRRITKASEAVDDEPGETQETGD